MDNVINSEKESIKIISEMIERSKQRIKLEDGKVLLIWGYTTVIVALLVAAVLMATNHPAANWLWFLIWIVAGTWTAKIDSKTKEESLVTTHIDYVTRIMWSVVGISSIVAVFICLGFMLFAGKDCWSLMLIWAMTAVGFAVAVQGALVKEKSLVYGGVVGMICGLVIAGAVISGVELCAGWMMPLTIVAFTFILIIPGHVLNAKARRYAEGA